MTKTVIVLGAIGFALIPLTAGCSAPADESASAGAQVAPPIEAGAELPSDHPPLAQRQDQMIAPVDPSAGTGASGMSWDVPDGWVAEAPANSMRRAQYRVPATGGDSRDAECVVFYFGPGQGGDAMSNAERWANQFIQPDGASSVERMESETRDVGGIEVLRVEVTGTYQSGGPMMGGSGEQLPDYMLLGAVASGADANWFFKFTGPRATIEANQAAFDALIGSLQPGA